MKLKELKTIDFKTGEKYDFILPLGSTEQHGPFIPLGTDTYIVDYIVNQVSILFPNIIILPTLEYSRSQEHRGFYGTVWLTEETLEKVMLDICSSLQAKARNIYFISFHANDQVIKKFIKKYLFDSVKLTHLEIEDEEDNQYIQENILMGKQDAHAGNSEISNMLVINEKLVKIPPPEYSKFKIEKPWETDNVIEKSKDGIVDNHPEWVLGFNIGKEILDIYTKRIVVNLEKTLICVCFLSFCVIY